MGQGVAVDERRQRAAEPEDLSRLFLERANAGDVEGLVELYEPGAVLAFPPGRLSTGSEAIRAAYEELLAGRPTFGAGDQRPAIRNDTGDLALTSTRLAGRGATAEVARRQPDGSWLWIIDQPAVLG
jgi:ketosteroid isomerase-like protein